MIGKMLVGSIWLVRVLEMYSLSIRHFIVLLGFSQVNSFLFIFNVLQMSHSLCSSRIFLSSFKGVLLLCPYLYFEPC